MSISPQSELPQSEKAARFRRNAAACGTLAASAVSSRDRALLLRMQRSWLGRACHADSLSDMPPAPPAGALALPWHRRPRTTSCPVSEVRDTVRQPLTRTSETKGH